ncbi:uncharacterized protein LOC118409462 [Branchiostoma floridae]|uniref:Uncharacterized protein LOC118409462 n=1 Tax=Branchiostoma floridae TaxID=7739 RepID=A0A9J7HYC9_BRAFL|nr:uncharacterized protein LOC118409462 [Branchiostoma floridae]
MEGRSENEELFYRKSVDGICMWLSENNFRELVPTFEEQDIDGTAFLALHYGAVRSLVPRVGPRLRFWQAYLKLFPHKRKLAKHRQPQSAAVRTGSRGRKLTIRETTVQERTVTNRTVRFHNSTGVGGQRSGQNRSHSDAAGGQRSSHSAHLKGLGRSLSLTGG